MHAAVVDPSRVVLKLVAKLFMDRGDKVSTFVNSEQALQSIKADRSINVLLTSLETGPLPGLELCWQARLAAGNKRPLFIIVMSSQGDQENVIQALDCGADDLIVKPISQHQLGARLRMAERLQSTQMHLIRLAETDPLTGLFNRRAFFERLEGCLQEHPASATPLSAIMLDIDFFKKVNDAHGHLSGDEVITAVAAQAAQCAAFAGRLGGEEFALVLSGVDDHTAAVIAEDLRLRCAGLLFPGKAGPFGITCSLGIASAAPGDRTDDLLRRADRALYEAKAAGRNCTRVAGGQTSDWWTHQDSNLKIMHS